MATSGRDVFSWAEGKVIATTHASSFGENAEPEANARLIAAAPDLLAALSCCLADLEGVMPEFDPSGDREHSGWTSIDQAREAIEKATI